MLRAVVLDSHPLSLLSQRPGLAEADACAAWSASLLTAGISIYVPEIADFEVRRELIRAGRTVSIQRLDAFIAAVPTRYLPITTAHMRLAAQLWAQVRNAGLPTADPKELDGDVILAAQALSLGLPAGDLIVATSSPRHLTRFAAADRWQNIPP